METQTKLDESTTIKQAASSDLTIQSASGPIVMAVDPGEGNVRRQNELFRAVRLWMKGTRTSILPVGVASLRDIIFPVEMLLPMQDSFLTIVDKTLAPQMAKLSPEEALPPKLLIQQEKSRRTLARALVQAALEAESPIIALNTHGRKGLLLFRLGGFTQEVIAQSPLPVLVVNPKSNVSPSVESILFVTDLLPRSKDSLNHAIALAKQFDAKLIIYHRFQVPGSALAKPDYRALNPMLVEKFWQEVEAQRKLEGESWRTICENAGVNCEFEMNEDLDICEGINRVAKERGCDLVLLENKRPIDSGPGVMIRDIICSARKPVVLFRTEKTLQMEHNDTERSVSQN